MQSSLALTALLMGLVGGPHCVAMCGAACAGLGQAAGTRKNTALLTFQLGRVIGYSALGALAAASMQGLGWLTVQSAALRPVWTLFHVAAAVLGLVLLWSARQPVWLESIGRGIWAKARALGAGGGAAAAGHAVGFLALRLVVLRLVGGSYGRRAFGWCSGDGFICDGYQCHDDGWAVAVAALAASSGWALWMGLVHNTAPWCAP